MKVRVYDGSMHAVDSKPIAFELCAKEGFKAAAPKCKPVIHGANHETGGCYSGEFVGSVIGDLNRRRGFQKDRKRLVVRCHQADVPFLRCSDM
jgi:elongation factor G